MAPAFGLAEANALLPYFVDAVTKAREFRLYLILEVDSGPYRQMADKWSSIIENGKSGQSAIIDVNMWLGKATLDAYVLAIVLGVRELRINLAPTSRKDRRGGFRLRLWRPERCGQPVYQILHEHNV